MHKELRIVDDDGTNSAAEFIQHYGDEWERVAGDGKVYTKDQFMMHYGQDHWQHYWAVAAPADATEVCEGGVSSAGAEQGGNLHAPAATTDDPSPSQKTKQADSPDAKAEAQSQAGAAQPGAGDAAIEQTPEPAPVQRQQPQNQLQIGAGASQPGAEAAGAAPPFETVAWRDARFISEVLPQNKEKCMEVLGEHPIFFTARDLLNAAYNQLYDHLPLLAEDFTNCALAGALGEVANDACIVIERINRVLDGNRPPKVRVDFFSYHADGYVVRYHPGATRSTTMTPHRMPPGSPLFSIDCAREQGVGQALHLIPPGMVRANAAGALQPGMPPPLLASREDLDLVCPYDAKMNSWSVVRDILRRTAEVNQSIQRAEGEDFPWWLWLANTGKVRDVVSHGVLEITLDVTDGFKAIIVRSDAGEFRIYAKGEEERMGIKPVPPKFDASPGGQHGS